MTRFTAAGPGGRRTVVGMSALLDGKKALVTGAGSGIGAAVARRLAADGAAVHAVDLDAERVTSLAAENDLITPLACDLSDLDAVEQLPGDIDVLVNNAGRQHVSRLEEFDPDTFSQILRLMLESPFRLIRKSLPHMYSRGWGRVVNISSAHGLRASPYKSAYVSAKHGLEGLSKVTALEGAEHGVTSNCINPAYVRTPLVEAQIADQARTHGISEDEVIEKIMLTPVAVKRLIEPAETAELAALLWGPASASITGTSLSQDGGWTAR
ncbi:3-hydroxybutyrate dehydrogenase [Pseudonocardia ammonioxydans]|uniref:3-hydroxybutyrate dehydrogenase n=2 Tax=Pseudonocardia ammonioxydans TaxID=260086 RepID=A0A1I4VPU2_PSUAM|nr:3-hydroxybutyrate dehydrogenase [Pseudonocardia ammonioxydans]